MGDHNLHQSIFCGIVKKNQNMKDSVNYMQGVTAKNYRKLVNPDVHFFRVFDDVKDNGYFKEEAKNGLINLVYIFEPKELDGVYKIYLIYYNCNNIKIIFSQEGESLSLGTQFEILKRIAKKYFLLNIGLNKWLDNPGWSFKLGENPDWEDVQKVIKELLDEKKISFQEANSWQKRMPVLEVIELLKELGIRIKFPT
ncbi:hypothetical protein A3C57_02455 [Candidatus Nomurabacteria bacterium RIFCSPHIGHO2_02_FULL_33_12]|uniref:Uncharacterized protein n=1 Tax=Candidatus Nomurabacteria bacterium RIFCSPLOWO2_01_FULL_33_17 TaxID=1801764 RepID=A0A1F6WMV9_9BACT|nr:MAG: hypothetical protein A3C57_02455 [Candidatus Nomurabacteria bacterium RIFCSPHIGHO2_02_FULL_33_12]OGI83213.1 MAG: hypothetical protein A2903_00845 [Candidatus Nomurabacteria bacterium RIFCSPLOWO2_01_FULL_33_17]